MIEINLLPEELRKKSEPVFSLDEMPIKKGLKIFLIAIVALQITGSVFAVIENSRFDQIRKELGQITAENREITAQKTQMLLIKKRIKDVDGLASRPFYWSKLLEALTNSVTKGVWLTSLSVEQDRRNYFLKIEGSVVAKGEETAYIGKFIKELEQNPVVRELFEEIKLSNINQKKIKDFDVYDFYLICRFKKGKV